MFISLDELRKSSRIALISVYHKDGIEERVQRLVNLGFGIISSGGTAKRLNDAGIPVCQMSELVTLTTKRTVIEVLAEFGITGDEVIEKVNSLVKGDAILGHRVVTLSREKSAALLATYSDADKAEMVTLGIPYIDMVACDLYPLEGEIAREGSTRESVIELTDIGGPTMIREAAKGRRILVCRESGWDPTLEWLESGEPNSEEYHDKMSAEGEAVITEYCAASARYHSGGVFEAFFGRRVKELRYGENPWQKPAYLFTTGSNNPLAIPNLKTVAGKEAGYINETDSDRLLRYMTCVAAAWEKNFGFVPFIAIGVKHGNACGAAAGHSPIEVIKKMIEGDPRAIFGGSVMTNFPLGKAEGEVLRLHMSESKRGLDVVIAPSIDDEAARELERIEGGCRMTANPALSQDRLGLAALDLVPEVRFVTGGFLVQPSYDEFVLDLSSELVSHHGETTLVQQMSIVLAYCIAARSNSNTITLTASDKVGNEAFIYTLIGNGVGQQDRVGAAELAIKRAQDAGHKVTWACAVSDSFIPYLDAAEVLAKEGVGALLTCSGSKAKGGGDAAVFSYLEEQGIPLVSIPNNDGRGFFGH